MIGLLAIWSIVYIVSLLLYCHPFYCSSHHGRCYDDIIVIMRIDSFCNCIKDKRPLDNRLIIPFPEYWLRVFPVIVISSYLRRDMGISDHQQQVELWPSNGFTFNQGTQLIYQTRGFEKKNGTLANKPGTVYYHWRTHIDATAASKQMRCAWVEHHGSSMQQNVHAWLRPFSFPPRKVVPAKGIPAA